MTDTPDTPAPVQLARLPRREPHEFSLMPGAATRTALAGALGIDAIKKLRFAGRLVPEGSRDWSLEADLGATVVQPCRVTLAPVTTRIDETVTRRYLAEVPVATEGGETEMPEDDTAEPLPERLDLAAVMAEALVLALPPFPRAPGVDPGDLQLTEPGKAPLTDADVKPFAGLAALRDTLGKDG